MKNRSILIVGDSFPTLRTYLRQHSIRFVTLRDIRLSATVAEGPTEFVPCDFSSEATIAQAVAAARKHIQPDGIINIYERYVMHTARIAAKLNLPAIPLDAAEACTDKFLMRQKFAVATEPISPEFQVVTSEQDLEAFALRHRFPLILKPANLSKSLLVSKNHDLDELLANYRDMMTRIDALYARYATRVTPKILVEEFMEGPVHSVDAFVDSQGTPHVLHNVVDYQTGYDIGHNDNFHYSRILPSTLSGTDIQAIRHVAELGCRALGMKNTPAHIEVIRTADGPRIVEIGARNGGYRERMHNLANGVNISGNAVRIALGEQPDITAHRNESVGVFELFPHHTGTFIGIAELEALRALPSCAYVNIKAKPGQEVGKASEGYKACAVVILHHADPVQFRQDRAFLDTQVSVITAIA